MVKLNDKQIERYSRHIILDDVEQCFFKFLRHGTDIQAGYASELFSLVFPGYNSDHGCFLFTRPPETHTGFVSAGRSHSRLSTSDQ